ncbi:MAG TPA: flavodoxin domain-containing protein [Flavisolibacter sp.]|nr:flavodoxin domain-containing protein [Flavisolibacter sp.]
MLPDPKMKMVRELVADLSREEIIWLNGYLSGVASPVIKQGTIPTTVRKITIAYATESGNSKKLAAGLAARAKKSGIQSKLVSLDQYRLSDLTKEEWFFTIISTQGEGEPPATAKKFYDHLHQGNITLSNVRFGVLALGDTAYPLFCKAGEDVDAQLQKLGATRIIPLQKLDTDYEIEAENWVTSLLDLVSNNAPVAPQLIQSSNTKAKQLFTGQVLTSINLNATGSSKETFHIEIAANGVPYEPGDALGLLPKNPATVVNKILSLSGADEKKLVNYRNAETPLGDLLRSRLSVIHLSERVVKKYSEVVKQDIPITRMDLLDLLRIYPISQPSQFVSIVEALDPITPRLYSISSSPLAHPDEVHLTVARNTFCIDEQQRNGLCSNYLSLLKEGEEFDFYIHKNQFFKLPSPGKDIIMIGPGTGIAPFRSFVAQRDAEGVEGRSWLFFGDQHFTTDFLYQAEWQNWLQVGSLTRMNVAFSRDQEQKLYVQHKLLQHAEELFSWIDGGAYVYICGTKDPMSTDVENTLVQIIAEYRHIDEDQAQNYLIEMKESGRLLKDVY